MKTILLFFLFVYSVSFAQIIKGTVVDDKEHRLNNVNIYIDGTKTGTVSQEDGTFTLSLSPPTSGNIIFQKEDYETFSTEVSEVINKNLKVVLTKTNTIEEIVLIPYTSEAYTKYIHAFLRNFIGDDLENVRIKNQKTLKFSYDKKKKLLRVKAPKTLLIENKNLGYEIEYNLIDYSTDFNTNITNYTGTSFFKETKNTDRVKINRMNAYDGSSLHFFRSIYNNKVSENGFIINQVVKLPNSNYPTEEELNTLKDFMTQLKLSETINIPEDIKDISRRKNSQQSYILAITKTLIPDSDYVKRTNEQVIFGFKDILQVNYTKIPYEDIKKNQFIKGKYSRNLTTYLYSDEGESFEVSKDGNITTPDQLVTQGEFSRNKIEKMLPLDYQLGD
ncbi:carboxypeptidase-like regulatory domain-containing protein [Chryseobacterium capnotolerans]|uniref:carboxypeptidase-like regulatory domain-containing protein n=1 Tax=Chryseobacterium TaxID=59732 RepID=UPI00083AE9BC|nr:MULTISPECIES: carboxypeptidase-like regulatory domain-containing protein [Chryseobacterium]UHO37714.1 carboxypeptidase-like regulatory domain-containing protein [Chryseobacterium capnotolerans]